MGILALRTRDYTNITGAQATHHGDVRYSLSSAHECLLSQQFGQCLDLQVYGINSSGLWDKLDILGDNFTTGVLGRKILWKCQVSTKYDKRNYSWAIAAFYCRNCR